MPIVYQHIRKDTNEVFYIGIGKTIQRANSIFGRNKYWNRIAKKYGYQVEITHKDIIWEEACSIEKYLIEFYGRADLQKGILVNMTDGGDGQENPSKETRVKMSLARKSRITKQETKEKIRQSKIGKKRPDNSSRLIILNKSESHRLKNSISKIGENNPMFGKIPKHSKKVEEIETGKVFNSKLEAAKYYKISVTKLSSLIDRKIMLKYKN